MESTPIHLLIAVGDKYMNETGVTTINQKELALYLSTKTKYTQGAIASYLSRMRRAEKTDIGDSPFEAALLRYLGAPPESTPQEFLQEYEMQSQRMNQVRMRWGFKENEPTRHLVPNPPDEIPNHLFEQVEFKTVGVEVRCITHSLYWASETIEKHIDDIIETKNKFRYLLTEDNPQGQSNLKRIRDVLAKHKEERPIVDLSDAVQVRSVVGLSHSSPLTQLNIPFPIANDIVLYDWLPGFSQDWDVYNYSVTGVKPFSKDFMNGRSLRIGKYRARVLRDWFDAIWSKLDDGNLL